MGVSAIEAAKIVPSPRQMIWQEMEFYGFIHYTVNTFTDREWGDGEESPAIFNPTELDAVQWVEVCRSAGMKGVILTCKHHDGFCLWPTAYTEHSVKNSPWRDGKGDLVREVADACRAAGMKFGIYVSPWDRHEPCYGNSAEYNTYFVHQLRELLTGYGELFCVWFDGACGEGPNGKRQVYDWDAYYAIIRELQPNAVISVCGPDVRWCGNEAGFTRSEEWSVVPATMRDNERIQADSQQSDDREFAKRIGSEEEDLGSRKVLAATEEAIWYPAEVNTSIRPGWFYHASEDEMVKELDHLIDLYERTVGGNSTFLLNLPPDTRGLIHENDAKRMQELGTRIREAYSRNLASGGAAHSPEEKDADHQAAYAIDGNPLTFWCPEDGVEQAELELDLGNEQEFDRVVLQEFIRKGQRVERYCLQGLDGEQWRTLYEGTIIGYKRICRFEPVKTSRLRLLILESRCSPTISAFEVYSSGLTASKN